MDSFLISHAKSSCCGCGVCSNICPKNCITLIKDNEGFCYPLVDEQHCINCNLCSKVCPFGKTEPIRHKKPATYISYSFNEKNRLCSSSGGVFTEIASFVFAKKGVVYGVSMSDNMLIAKHIRIENECDLNKLRGSKYIQSETGNVFKNIKEDLACDRYVLFSGTPCQVSALKYYLKKDYPNLFMVEVVCHGVPSPKLWLKYVKYIEKKYKAVIECVNFREKKNKPKPSKTTNDSCKVYKYFGVEENPFMMMFLKNYSLRPSCYNCVSKQLDSNADVALADAWGIEQYAPELCCYKDLNAIFIQTSKGQELINSIKDKVFLEKVDFEQAIKYNPSYYLSSSKPELRDTFFEDADYLPFLKLEKKYCRLTIKQKTKLFLKKIFPVKMLTIFLRKKRLYQLEYGILITLNKSNNQ